MSDASQQLESFMIPGGNYGYTAMPPNFVASFRSTLAVGLLDESGSTNSFAKKMENFCKELLKSLRKSDEADAIIYRQCHFASGYREVHGFTPLANLNENQYDGCYISNGETACYDSCVRVINELGDYGKQHKSTHRLCNGFLFVVTDGMDSCSSNSPRQIREALEKLVSDESMESVFTVLIGVNDNPTIQTHLQDLCQEIGFTKYIPLSKADEKSLSHLAGWVSQQLQSQSQSLGTGGPSQALTF